MGWRFKRVGHLESQFHKVRTLLAHNLFSSACCKRVLLRQDNTSPDAVVRVEYLQEQNVSQEFRPDPHVSLLFADTLAESFLMLAQIWHFITTDMAMYLNDIL